MQPFAQPAPGPVSPFLPSLRSRSTPAALRNHRLAETRRGDSHAGDLPTATGAPGGERATRSPSRRPFFADNPELRKRAREKISHPLFAACSRGSRLALQDPVREPLLTMENI